LLHRDNVGEEDSLEFFDDFARVYLDCESDDDIGPKNKPDLPHIAETSQPGYR